MSDTCSHGSSTENTTTQAASPARKKFVPTLDWDVIAADVVRAKRDMAKDKRYVKVNHLIEYIKENREKYPGIGVCGDTALKMRIAKSFTKKGWPRYTGKMARSQVYVDPEVGG